MESERASEKDKEIEDDEIQEGFEEGKPEGDNLSDK